MFSHQNTSSISSVENSSLQNAELIFQKKLEDLLKLDSRHFRSEVKILQPEIEQHLPSQDKESPNYLSFEKIYSLLLKSLKSKCLISIIKKLWLSQEIQSFWKSPEDNNKKYDLFMAALSTSYCSIYLPMWHETTVIKNYIKENILGSEKESLNLIIRILKASIYNTLGKNSINFIINYLEFANDINLTEKTQKKIVEIKNNATNNARNIKGKWGKIELLFNNFLQEKYQNKDSSSSIIMSDQEILLSSLPLEEKKPDLLSCELKAPHILEAEKNFLLSLDLSFEEKQILEGTYEFGVDETMPKGSLSHSFGFFANNNSQLSSTASTECKASNVNQTQSSEIKAFSMPSSKIS